MSFLKRNMKEYYYLWMGKKEDPFSMSIAVEIIDGIITSIVTRNNDWKFDLKMLLNKSLKDAVHIMYTYLHSTNILEPPIINYLDIDEGVYEILSYRYGSIHNFVLNYE
jgi:hypothetical protein